MKTHENQPATGKNRLPRRWWAFHAQGTQVSIWASRSSSALGATGRGPLQKFHDGWRVIRDIGSFTSPQDTWDHSELQDGLCMTRHDIPNFEEKNIWSYVIVFVGWFNQNPCGNNTNHLKHSCSCTFTFLTSWHRQILVLWMGEATKAEGFSLKCQEKAKAMGMEPWLTMILTIHSGHLNHGTSHDQTIE